jgi:hypothetical protein
MKFSADRGLPFQRQGTGDDVTTHLIVWGDGGTVLPLPADRGNLYLQDVIIPQAATMTRIQVSANGLIIGEGQINPQACLGGNQSRQFVGAPVPFKSGAVLQLTQLT